MSTAITLRHVSKKFLVPHQPYFTIRERFLHALQPRTFTRLLALNNISFTVNRGEFFGIIGRNGSGKSTLLKIIAGIYYPSNGVVQRASAVCPFLELGVGFHPELTVRENIFLSGAVLGISRTKTKKHYDAIIDFSELQKFSEMKLRQLSSGMQVRLAFATFIQVDDPILLIDEAFAVGDITFQAKCLAQLVTFKRQKRTIIFVSHDIHQLGNLCQRLAYLDQGKLRALGEPSTVLAQYQRESTVTLV